MRTVCYFMKSNIYEILASVVAVVLVIYSKYQAISFLIIIIYLIVLIYLKTRENPFYFISFLRRAHKDKWIGRGNFEYNRSEKCFEITDAGSGYIYSDCLTWSDYQFEFDFKIINRCLGSIIRAVNLANYAMLQITPNGIRPHIRINSGWKVWEAKQAQLEFSNNLSLDQWYTCKINCVRESINIRLYDNGKEIFNRSWRLPQGVISFSFKKDEEDVSPLQIPFSINLEYGSVGFRNWNREKAFIKNVLVKKI